jgi:hypothetical protein
MSGLAGGHPDHAYYSGKIAAARYFAFNILPGVFVLKDIIKNADQSAIECPEEAFLIR